MLLLERLAAECEFEVVPEDFQKSLIDGKAFKEPSERYFPSSEGRLAGICRTSAGKPRFRRDPADLGSISLELPFQGATGAPPLRRGIVLPKPFSETEGSKSALRCLARNPNLIKYSNARLRG